MALFIKTYVLAIIAFLPMMNPPTTAVLLLGLGRGQTAEWTREQVRKTALYVFLTLSTAYLFGSAIMSLFGISLLGLQLAGALIVSFIGFRMLFPSPLSTSQSALTEDSIAFVPLTMPSLCGPGTLALVISSATEVQARVTGGNLWWVHAGIICAFATLALICWVTLRLSERIDRMLGPSGLDALTRIMGFLLICLGMQFLINVTQALMRMQSP